MIRGFNDGFVVGPTESQNHPIPVMGYFAKFGTSTIYINHWQTQLDPQEHSSSHPPILYSFNAFSILFSVITLPHYYIIGCSKFNHLLPCPMNYQLWKFCWNLSASFWLDNTND